jgi:hypothetical protein
MTTTSHERMPAAPERRRWSDLLVTETWASLAISIIWLTVLFDALFGPDIKTVVAGAASTSTTVVPSAVIISVFAFLATWVVARHGLRRDQTD